MKNPLVILTGPTAVGKTTLSIELAKAINGEIISADSMQVYQHMNIGSAKVRPDEMDGIKHYLIDILEPTQDFNIVLFQKYAKEAIDAIYAKNKLPIIVGGTGFYIQSVLYDIDFHENSENATLRRQLEQLVLQNGADYLHNMLKQIDPKAAQTIHANNIKRVIRAIEYYQQTGEKISDHNEIEREKEAVYNFCYFVLTDERQKLYTTIDRRVDQMIEEGLVDEVKQLMAMGCKRNSTAMQGLGYKEIFSYLLGEISLDDAIYRIKRDTRHFAKRQLTWFRHEKNVTWLEKYKFAYNETELLNYIKNKVMQKIQEDCDIL